MAIRLPDDQCPVCSELLDSCTPLDGIDAGPKAGDFTVCIYCKAILVFDSMLRLHEMDKINDENLKEIQDFIDEAL